MQDRLRIARETPPNVPVSSAISDDGALEDVLEQQCNIQDLDIGNYNYKYDQDDVSNSKIKA